jgi:hypothetical protein
LFGLLEGFGRARFHALNFFLDVPLVAGHHRLRQKRRAERADIQHMQRRHIGRLDEGQLGHPVQPPSPILRSIRRHEHIHGACPFY